jgi:hypothetical protein
VSALAGFTRAQDAYTASEGAPTLNKSLAIQFAGTDPVQHHPS